MDKFENSEEWMEFLKDVGETLFKEREPVPVMLAEHLIEINKGTLAVDEEEGVGVSLSMGNEGLAVTFYELVDEDSIRVTDTTDIVITEGFVSDVVHLISLCKKKSMVKDINEGEEVENFGKMYG